MSHQKKQEHHIRPYKIAAQSAGLIVCIFVVLFFAGKGTPEILKMDQNELIPFVPLLLLPVVGYLLTWYKELAGAIMMIAGGALLLVFFLIKGDASIGLVYGLPFILSGSIFLVHINKRTQLKRKL
jgi:predicted membrane protein